MSDNNLTVEKKETKQIKAAKKIIDVCINRIKIKMRFFLYILSALKLVPVKEDVLLCTDGENLYFNAKRILLAYKAQDVKKIEWTIFHILLHGLLGHFENTTYSRTDLAWAVMDLQVERLMSLIYPEIENMDLNNCWEDYDDDEDIIGDDFLADELYYKGLQSRKLRKRIIKKGEKALMDNHAYWYYTSILKKQDGESIEGEKDNKQERIRAMWSFARGLMDIYDGSEPENAEEKREKGLQHKIGGLLRGTGSLAEENRVDFNEKSQNSYEEIFKEIVAVSEISKDDDSIDKALYMYGLELYGDVPLVEPEEINETKHINTMILAVDTSGSCTESAAFFLKEMSELLEQIKEKISIDHICYLECDDEITVENNYYYMEEFIGFGKTHTFIGGGGTSFVPVFDRTEELIKQGKKIDILFYFSDCDGKFPEKEPTYPTVFLRDMQMVDRYFRSFNDDNWIPKWVKVIDIKN